MTSFGKTPGRGPQQPKTPTSGLASSAASPSGEATENQGLPAPASTAVPSRAVDPGQAQATTRALAQFLGDDDEESSSLASMFEKAQEERAQEVSNKQAQREARRAKQFEEISRVLGRTEAPLSDPEPMISNNSKGLLAQSLWSLQQDGIVVPAWNKHTGADLEIRRAEVLQHIPAQWIRVESLAEKTQIPTEDLQVMVDGLGKLGLVESHPTDPAIRLSDAGLHSVHTRTGTDRMGQSGYASLMDAQMRSLLISVKNGYATTRDWEQGMANSLLTLNREVNALTRLSLADIASQRASEFVATLATPEMAGVEPPKHLEDLANAFRETQPPELRNVIEGAMQQLDRCQEVANLAVQLREAPESASQPSTYRNVLEGAATCTTVQTAALLGAQTLSGPGNEINGQDAATIAGIFLKGRPVRSLEDLEQCLPPSVAVSALVHGGGGKHLAFDAGECKELIESMSRIVLTEKRGDIAAAARTLGQISNDLGFLLEEGEKSRLVQNLHAIKKLDEQFADLHRPFAMLTEDQPVEQRREAAQQILDAMGENPRVRGLLWVEARLMDGDYNGFRRSVMAAEALRNHPSADEEQRLSAAEISDVGLLYVRHVFHDNISRKEQDEFADAFLRQERKGLDLLISEMNGNPVGDIAADVPWATSFKEEEMASFLHGTGLSCAAARTVLTARAFERAWANERETRERQPKPDGVPVHQAFPDMDLVVVTQPQSGWDRDALATLLAANRDMIDADGAVMVLSQSSQAIMVPVRDQDAIRPAVAGAKAHGGEVILASLGDGQEVAQALRQALADQGVNAKRFTLSMDRFQQALTELGENQDAPSDEDDLLNP